VSVEDVTADLQKDDGDKLVYALANAVGAATMAQLKLDSFADTASASWMEAECHRARSVDGKGRYASLDTLRIAFFLHVYHENLEPGDVSSLSYLCEAITLAQIMGLHRESTYIGLSTSQQESRRRILWLLFVTERYVPFVDQRLVTDLAKRGCNASQSSSRTEMQHTLSICRWRRGQSCITSIPKACQLILDL
jgi:hypothetical protein